MTRMPSPLQGDLSRRDMLRVAAGLGLSFVVPGLTARAANARGTERAKSLILLWCSGGASQLESWDPHPGTKIGGDTKAIKTNVAGLNIAEHYPRMAEQMDQVCLIRSMVSKEGDHERATYLLKTGWRPETTLVHPSLGAILSHKYEEEKQTSVQIPRFVSLMPNQWPGRGGFLGDQFDAFKVFDPGQDLHNMRAPVADKRHTQRLQSLSVVEQSFARRRKVLSKDTLHQETVQQALQMMSSDQLKAFKIEEESAERKKAYGDTQFGRGCLTARRLVEVGVRAVEVTLDGFDTHADNFTGQKNRGITLDPAFAALMQDLKERDLLASTVVLCVGEFGRTPNINPLSGRDHWPTGFSAVVAGGGFKGGLVVGATDPEGKKTTPEDPFEVNDLYATILSVLGVEFATEHITPIGRPMKFSDGKVQSRLLIS